MEHFQPVFEPAVLDNQGGPCSVEVGKCDPHLKEGQKKVLGHYRSVSLTSMPGKITECHHTSRVGQSEHQAEPACVCKRQVLLDILPADVASPRVLCVVLGATI